MLIEASRMETVPTMVPAPAIVSDQRSKPVIIRPPEVSAAHDFAVIGYILTFLLSLPWVIISLVIGGIGVAAYLGYAILPPTLPAALTVVPYVGTFLEFLTATLSPSFWIYMGLGGGALLVALIFLGVLYFSTVGSINKGRYEKARNSLLFFGVLFIIPSFFILFAPDLLYGTVVTIIPAFFFLMSYGRLGEVIAKYGPVAIMGEAVPGAAFAGGPGPMPIAAGPPGQAGQPMSPMPPGGPMPGMGVPPIQPLTGVAPRIPLCPGCGKELYYSANHRRWYCMNCDNPSGHR
jgi:hypothetical protein